MTIPEPIQKILNDFNRTEVDFKALVDFFVDCDNPLAVKWAKSAIEDYPFHNEQIVVNARKRVKVMARVGVLSHPLVNGDINVDKKMESIREVVVPVDVLLYKDLLTGLYKFEFAIPKNFLMGREDYDADPIAHFQGMDVKEKKDYGQLYLVFIKEYNLLEYLTIDDLLIEPKMEEDKKFINSKQILTFDIAKSSAEQIVSKTVEFTAVLENLMKQFMLNSF